MERLETMIIVSDSEEMKLLNEYFDNWKVINHMTKTNPLHLSEVLSTMRIFKGLFRTNWMRTMQNYIRFTKFLYWQEFDDSDSD